MCNAGVDPGAAAVMVSVMWEMLRFVVILCAVAYGGLALFAMLFTNRMLFPQPPASYAPSPEIVHIPGSPGGEGIATLYLPHAGSDRLLLYSHGNHEDLGTARPRLELMHSLGFNVLAWDYPGYGLSGGRPGERTVNAAVEAVHAYARDKLGHPPEQTVLHGFSIGAGPTLHLAVQAPFAAVIIESAFTSAFDVVVPFRFLPWDVFDNAARIRDVSSPVLIIHGTSDAIVPFAHAKRLLSLAPRPRSFLWVEGAGHNNLPATAGAAYTNTIRRFTEARPVSVGGISD